MAMSTSLTLRSTDLKDLLGTNPSTLADLYKRLDIRFAEEQGHGSVRGRARHLFGEDVRRVLEARGYSFSKPTKIISFMMCKGGVGKTTSTFFLAQRLSSYGARVLAIDADPQGNLTSAFDLEAYNIKIDVQTPILADIVTNKTSMEAALLKLTPMLHLLPSTPLNATLEGKIREQYKNPSLALKRHLDPLLASYDYILIDCAPAFNLTNVANVSASNLVVLPVAPDKFSRLGLDQTLNEIEQIKSDFNLNIETKIVFTKYDARELTSLYYLTEIAHEYERERFKTAIRTCSDVKNAITSKEDLFSKRGSNAKEDYDSLTQEIMNFSSLVAPRRGRSQLSEQAS